MLLVALLAALAPTGEVALAIVAADTFLPAPAGPDLRLALDVRRAPPKARLMFTSPWAAGRHRLSIAVAGGSVDRTLVVATPVAPGRSSFEVTIAGAGRVDLGFWGDRPAAAPKEYRFTVFAPAKRTFELDLPAR